MKYTDPFGLSPEDGGNRGGNFWHSLLGFVGMIPGPVGVVANAVDAVIYFSEGNYAMAAMCALDAVIPAAGAVGKALAGTCKYARIGREIVTGAKVANTVFNLSRGMYNADRAVGSFCERHKDDLFTENFKWTKADTADLLGFGLSTLTCIASGKSLAKDLDDFMAASTDLATLGTSVGCFVAGTTVKTEEGDKAIEEIEVGDRVLAYEATTGRFAYKEVVDIIAHDGVTELAHVTVGGETIDSTTNHPYFVVGYGYVDAGNLIEGDTILLANGEEAKVEKVEIEFLTEPVTVYNFEVKDWHCYFVGEAGVLVHNDGTCVNNIPATSGGNVGGNSGEGGRNSAGVVTGGETLSNAKRMMHGSQGNVGVIPKEIADKMRGRQYSNFDAFREDFWKTVADSSYSSEFSNSNIGRMRNGRAPKVVLDQTYGQLESYILHHKIPIHASGEVYNLDNLAIVTPRMHQEILDKAYHFGN